MEKLTVSLSFRNLVLNEQKNIIERSRNSPQSLFGPEEIKAGLLHVHLKPPPKQLSQQWRDDGIKEGVCGNREATYCNAHHQQLHQRVLP